MYGTVDATSITTMAAVESLDQPAGTVTVQPPAGSTMVEMTVEAEGSEVTVFLDYRMAARLMMTLGAAAKEL